MRGEKQGGRKHGKSGKLKKVLLNHYSSAMKKKRAQRDRAAAAAATAAKGDEMELRDIAAGGEKYTTGPSLWSGVTTTRTAAKAVVTIRELADAAEATAKSVLANAVSRTGNREHNGDQRRNNM